MKTPEELFSNWWRHYGRTYYNNEYALDDGKISIYKDCFLTALEIGCKQGIDKAAEVAKSFRKLNTSSYCDPYMRNVESNEGRYISKAILKLKEKP